MGTLNSKLSYHERLGSGASGEVFRVTWQVKGRGKVAAAKKIKFEGEIPDQLKREIEYLKKLDHRNIIKYYDTIIEEQHVVIVTEYAAKGSLYHYLKGQTKLPENLLHVWIFHLAGGINYLTINGIAHRDIKSPNCIITADDVLKICDFGIARDLTSTTTTNMMGSVRWLAPEVMKDQKLSPKSDIFAFAIIVSEMVMCQEPYKGMRVEAVMYQVCNEGLRPKIPEDCPPFLKDLMEKCWHANREMRPESSEVLMKLYREYRSDLGSQLTEMTEKDGLEWKLKHRMQPGKALQFVSNDRLAICRGRSVEVHQVTRESTQLLYKLTCNEWELGGRGVLYPHDVAVSESMPGSILVTCYYGLSAKYVYQFPCQESVDYVKKYQIDEYSQCIAANANTAVIGSLFEELVVYSLPGFTNPRKVHTRVVPTGVMCTTDYLVVLVPEEIVIKSLGSIDQDVCRIQAPDGLIYEAVSYRNDARQLYVSCHRKHDRKSAVYKYTWDGNGTPQYVNTGCVIDNLSGFRKGGMSISTDGLLALAVSFDVTQVFSLE